MHNTNNETHGFPHQLQAGSMTNMVKSWGVQFIVLVEIVLFFSTQFL